MEIRNPRKDENRISVAAIDAGRPFILNDEYYVKVFWHSYGDFAPFLEKPLLGNNVSTAMKIKSGQLVPLYGSEMVYPVDGQFVPKM